MRQDEMRTHLEAAAREIERRGRLPRGAEVRARGEQRRRRGRALRAVAAGLVVVGGVGAWAANQGAVQRGTAPPPASTVTTEPSPAPEEAAPGEAAVTLTTSAGLLLATTAEGGASLVAPGAVDGPTMSRWYLDPVSGSDRFLLRNAAQTDGRDVCLSMPEEGAVSVESCDPASSMLVFTVTPGEGGARTLRGGFGYIAAESGGGLTTSTDLAEAASFTVADPDRPGSVPDL